MVVLDLFSVLIVITISPLVVGILSTEYFINASAIPLVNDPSLKVETVISGLDFPTGIAFLGPDDILVTEKNDGTVSRFVNAQMLDQPGLDLKFTMLKKQILDLNVANQSERGLLGIDVGKSEDDHTHVYLYYTEAEGRDNGKILGNRLYKYNLINDELENPELLLDLAYLPGPTHNGGVVNIGPDGNVYLVTGNLFSPDINKDDEHIMTRVENYPDGIEADGRSGILRITPQGLVVNGEGTLGDRHPIDKYYAYGIRNSFGFTFDPVTGLLWDTENGGLDEINLVNPGFNSGWPVLSGRVDLDDALPSYYKTNPGILVDFDGQGKYSDPEFSWYEDSIGDVGPTGIVFLNSTKLGAKYENDMFVGDWHNGNVYRFDLNDNRTMLDLQGRLSDRKADTKEEAREVLFGEGFGGIVDLEVGPDGYLYILSLGHASIYRIVPKIESSVENFTT